MNKTKNETLEKIAPVRKYESYLTPITAPEFGYLQIDLMVMEKEATRNKNFKYGFVVIDIYSRYGDVIPIKNKTSVSCLEAFKKYINKINKNIISITTDNGSEYKGEFSKFLKEKDIYHKMVEPNDHHAMGIVDRFIQTIRRMILAKWVENGNLDWISVIDDVLKDYNNRFHKGIEETPNNVFENKAEPKLNDRLVDQLQIGDNVRILLPKSKFDKRSSTQNWSNEVYKVKSKDGNKYLLEDTNGRYARWELLKSNFEPVDKNKSIVETQNKIKNERAQERFLKKEGIDELNIVRGRTRNQFKRGNGLNEIFEFEPVLF